MSYHRYIVPPPLALAVHPAPPPRPSVKKEDKKDDKKDEKKDEKKDDKKGEKGEEEKNVKGDEEKKQAEADGDKGKVNHDAPTPPNDKDPQTVPITANVPAAPIPPTPASPGSMVPEPATPATGAPPTPAPEPKTVETVPAPNPGTPKGDSKTKGDEAKDTADKGDEAEKAPEPEPLRLLGPPPHRPLRTRLDLNQSRPYPPVQPDPRGAYHKYAKAIQGEMIYVDVTKDGWLAEQWRDRPEREALAKLRGETEKQSQREIEAERKRKEKRKVPRTAEGVLLDLWNDLAEAPMQEVYSDYFWSRYDWTDPDAQIHLSNLKHDEDGEVPKLEGNDLEWTQEGLEEILATVGVQCTYNTEKPLRPTWTEPAGAYLVMGHGFFMLRLEDLLQWKPEESANKFELLVTSNHDRIFGEMVKAQQLEERKKKEIAYRERKMAERKKAAEEEEAKNGGGKGKEGKDGKEEKEGKREKKGDEKEKKEDGKERAVDSKEEKREDKEDVKADGGKDAKRPENAVKDDEQKKRDGAKAKDVGKVALAALAASPGDTVVKTPVPDSPASNAKVLDGEEVKAPPPPNPIVGVADAAGHAVIAVPIQGEMKETAEGKKHEVEALAAAPEAKVEEKKQEKNDGEKKADPAGKKVSPQKKEEKPREQFDPMRDAELLAQMIQASGGGPDGPLGMDDIKLAFKALERAADSGMIRPGGGGGDLKKDKGPLIWTWQDSCERWRWRNFEAGLHEVGPGGWEERDWKVFADDRGCDEFDEDEEFLEVVEEDVHDWSC